MGRFYTVSMETLSETQYRVFADDPEDAGRRVRRGKGELIDSLDGEGNVTEVSEDEDQDA